MRNLETFLSKQMYPYLSLVERKVAEFYLNIDRMRWLVLVEMTYFYHFFRTIHGVLANLQDSRDLEANSFFIWGVIWSLFPIINLSSVQSQGMVTHFCGAQEQPKKKTYNWMDIFFKVLTNIKIVTVIVIDIILKPPKLDAS